MKWQSDKAGQLYLYQRFETIIAYNAAHNLTKASINSYCFTFSPDNRGQQGPSNKFFTSTPLTSKIGKIEQHVYLSIFFAYGYSKPDFFFNFLTPQLCYGRNYSFTY